MEVSAIIKDVLSAEEDSIRKFSKVYDPNERFVTSHDHLVASLFAEEKYHEFEKKNLHESSESKKEE